MSLRRLLLAVATFAAGKKNKTQNTTLTIAFTSDLHGEIKPLKHASTIYKQLSEPKLLVDVGDAFAGTSHSQRADPTGMGWIMRLLGYAVLGVGNHDLEHVAEFRDFSATANAPLVSTTLCQHYTGVHCSTTVQVQDLKVGFIGYVDTSSLGPAKRRPKTSCHSKMLDQVIAEATMLRQTVDLVIALGHCSYEVDAELYKRANHLIDAVVGGHIHVVRSNHGSKPVVLQAGVPASHLGLLELDLLKSKRGNVTVAAARAEMRALDAKRHHNDEVVSIMNGELHRHAAPNKPPWRQIIDGVKAAPCHESECALGNLVADAMARSCICRHENLQMPLISLVESRSLGSVVRPGPFGRDEATNVLPLANGLEVLRFPSVEALEALVAFGARSRPPRGIGGSFLQASSNTRVILDAKEARVLVRPFYCGATAEAQAKTLTFDDSAIKRNCGDLRGFSRPKGPVGVVVTSWLSSGGGGFDVKNATRLRQRTHTWLKDVDALRNHVAALPADATVKREGRISIVEDVTRCARPPRKESNMPPLVSGLLGALSMSASFVVTYPLSTLQTRAMLGEPLGLKDGCSSLYRGVTLAAVAVYTSGTVFWTTYESLSYVAGDSGGAAKKDFKTFSLTFIAGVLNVLVTNPLWVAVTRLQGGLTAMPSPAERSRKVCWPCAGILPNTVLVLFPTLRQTLYEALLRCASATTLTAGPALVSLAAAFATLIAATATHPLQWYRSRLQAGHVIATSRNEEKASIWDGLSIKLVHTVVSNTLMYLSKEQLTQFVLKTFLN